MSEKKKLRCAICEGRGVVDGKRCEKCEGTGGVPVKITENTIVIDGALEGEEGKSEIMGMKVELDDSLEEDEIALVSKDMVVKKNIRTGQMSSYNNSQTGIAPRDEDG